jgi:molecular chaperone HscA
VDVRARLAVDLGTSNTVAIVQPPEGLHLAAARSLLFDGSPLLPTGVHLAADGVLHTGRDAQRLALIEPGRYEPNPKRRVDDGTVLLGDTEVPVSELLGAVLTRVAEEAEQAGGDPYERTVLTCPADWGAHRRSVLLEAAEHAGLTDVVLVDEPVAAATYCVAVQRTAVPVGRPLVLFDFGAGTLDVALVRRDPHGWRLLSTGGLDDLGGLDVDEALAGHLGQLLELRDGETWRRLSRPATPGERRDRMAFWAEVRTAKEMLARSSVAPVQVPRSDGTLHLTREELDRVAGPLVARAVDETRRVVQRAEVQPRDLAGIFLVGGSSRLPLVASRLHERFATAPTVPEQPELPVAHGALLASEALPDGQTEPPIPVSPPVVPPMPPRMPPRSPVARPPRPRRPRRGVLAVAGIMIATFVVVAAISAVREWTDRSNETGGSSGDDRTGSLSVVHSFDPPRGTAAVAGLATATTGYYAVAGAERTQVVAVPVDGGDKWTVDLTMFPESLRLKKVGDLLVVDGTKSAAHNGANARAVVDTKSHRRLWEAPWIRVSNTDRRYDVTYLGDDVIVDSPGFSGGSAVFRVDLRTGKTRWTRPALSAVADGRRARAALSWPDAGHPANAVADGLGENLHVGTDVVELGNGGTVAVLANGSATPRRAAGRGAVPLDQTAWTVYEGVIVGAREAGGRSAIAGYRLGDLKPAWDPVLLPPGATVNVVKPCGPRLVCASTRVESTGAGDMLAIDTRTGKTAWQEPLTANGAGQSWFVGAKALLSGDYSDGAVREPAAVTWSGKRSEVLPPRYNSGIRPTVLAMDGGRVVVVEPKDSNNSTQNVEWRVACAILGTSTRTPSAEVGTAPEGKAPVAGATDTREIELVATISLAGDTIVTTTRNRKAVRVLRVRGLPG